MKKLLIILLFALPVLAQNHAHMLSGVNAQTGTTYTLVPADVTKVVTLNNAAAVVVTIPAASTDGFGAGTIFTVKNIGIGNVTVTPASGTINSQSSLLLTTGAGVDIYSDGSNFTSVGGAGSGGGSGGSACSVNIVCKGTGSGLPVVDSSVSDDSVNPVRATHGYNAAAGGISFEMANSASGTTANRLVCNDGTNHAILCADNVTSGILGTALTGAGTTGNVTVCSLINCPNDFDNQSVVNDFAIAGAAGKLHDTSSTAATSNNTNFLVLTANAGTGTSGQVRPPGDLSGGPAGMTNPMTTLGDIIYGGASGTPTRLAGASTLNGVPQVFTSTASGGLATAPTVGPAGVVPRIVSGTSDTILFTDRNKFIQYTNASPIAVTVPQAGTTGFAANIYFCAENRGAGAVTFTPTTSTVNGAATYVLRQDSSGCLVSDGANYVTKDETAIFTILAGLATGILKNTTGTGALSIAVAGDFPTLNQSTSGNAATATTLAAPLLISRTAPTVSSGFGTSPTISANNGTAAFRVNVGTGGSATAGIVGLPTATTGWNCYANDITAAAAHVAYNTVQTASSTTTATLENQTKSSGAAVAWAASDILAVSCFAY